MRTCYRYSKLAYSTVSKKIFDESLRYYFESEITTAILQTITRASIPTVKDSIYS